MDRAFSGDCKVLHDAAERLQVLFFMHHIQQRGIVFVDDDNSLFARLLISTLNDTISLSLG